MIQQKQGDQISYKPLAASSAISRRLIQLILLPRVNGPIKSLYAGEYQNQHWFYLKTPELP